MGNRNRARFGVLTALLVCAGSAGAQVPGGALHLQPSPAGVICAGTATAADGIQWTCDDVNALTDAFVADSANLPQDLPPAIRDLVLQLADARRNAGGH